MTEPSVPVLRMPLALGLTAGRALGVAALTLGPIVWCSEWALGAFEAKHWLAAAGLAGAALGSLWLALTSLWTAITQRPSDVELGRERVRVLGGRFAGLELRWQELDRTATELVGDRLVLAARDGRRIALALAGGDVERASLERLAATLRSAEYGSDPLPSKDAEPRPFACDVCGAPVTPVDGARARCAHCGASKTVPPELLERIRAADSVRKARPALERRARALLRQPGARRASLVLALVALSMLAAWAGAFGLDYHQSRHADVLRAGTWFSIWLFPFVTIAGLFLLHRATLVDRIALGLLTLGAGARRGPGGTALCPSCGAALTEREGDVVARCVFCGADAITGLDLRDLAAREARETTSVETTLAERRRGRLLYGLGGGALACLVLAHASRLFAAGAQLSAFTDVVHDQGLPGYEIYETEAAITDPALSRDAKQLLVIRRAPGREPELCRVESWNRLTPIWSAPGLRSPAWLDANRSLVIASEAGGFALHELGPSGGRRVLYRATKLDRASPSPRGDRVVLGAELEGRWSLVVVPLGGGAPRVVVPGRSPDWSPSDDHVVFVREVAGVSRLFVLDLATEPPAPEELMAANAFRYQDPVWSPCGSWIAYAANTGWEQARTGTREHTLNLFAVTFDEAGAGEHEPKILPLTQGSAATTHPSWGSGHLFFETDQHERAQVNEIDLGGEFETERYSASTTCAPGVHVP